MKPAAVPAVSVAGLPVIANFAVAAAVTAMLLLAAEPQFAGKGEANMGRVVDALHTFQQEHTAEWEQAIEAITQSTINHIKASQQLALSDPAGAASLVAEIYIPDIAPARRVTLSVDRRVVADETFSSPGVHTISVREDGARKDVTVMIAVDKTFSTAADQRKLGVVVTGIGFK